MDYLDYNGIADAINRTDFDHPFTIDPDGVPTIVHASGVYAPECYHIDGAGPWSPTNPDVDLCGSESEWEFASTGYTNQYAYRGPVLHTSESVSASMAQDFVENYPGAVFVMCSVECIDDQDNPAGWVILRRV